MRSNSAFDDERVNEIISLVYQLRDHAMMDGSFEARRILNGDIAKTEHVFELAAKRTDTLALRSVDEAEFVVMLSYLITFTENLNTHFSETADEVRKSYLSLRDGMNLHSWLSARTNAKRQGEVGHD